MQIVSFSFFNVGPARAGMIRRRACRRRRLLRWPRTSGDDPGPEGAPLIVKELAPHERG